MKNKIDFLNEKIMDVQDKNQNWYRSCASRVLNMFCSKYYYFTNMFIDYQTNDYLVELQVIKIDPKRFAHGRYLFIKWQKNI